MATPFTSQSEGSLGQVLHADIAQALDRVEARSGDVLRKMLLVALEREQVVSIAYSEQALAQHIGESLDAPPEVREIVRRALLWAHRDESLHAQFVRGYLHRRYPDLASPYLFVRQAAGTIGGWASTVSSTGGEESFGLRRLFVSTVSTIGTLSGKMPRALANRLSYTTFEDFCELNAALELSAVLTYERMLPHVPEVDRPQFDRILADEGRHHEVFTALHEAFDQDRLRPGVDTKSLIERIGSVSPWFLPADQRPGKEVPVTFGSGAEVYAAADSTIASSVTSLFESVDLSGLIAANGTTVAIRTQFMMGYDLRDPSNVVNPQVVEEIARQLRAAGATDVALLEAPTVYDRYFANRSVHEVASYFGLTSDLYRIVDVDDDLEAVEFDRGLAAGTISTTWLNADVRIILSKLRGDPSEIAHLSLQSLAGITGRVDGQVHLNRLVDFRTATLMALDVAPPDLAIVEAWGPVADGPIGVMGCNNPSHQQRIYAGRDALSVDAAVMGDLGFPNPSMSALYAQADQWFGAAPSAEPVVGDCGPIDNFRTPHDNWWFRFISATAAPVYFYFSDTGRLFVPDMDTTAFPPTDSPGRVVRAVRWGAQNLFGLHAPREHDS